MNMPPPPTARAYQKNARTVGKHVKVVAKDALPSSAKEITDAQHASEELWYLEEERILFTE